MAQNIANRMVELRRMDDYHAPGNGKAFMATVELHERTDGGISPVPSESVEFAFVTITEDLADRVRGEIPETEGTPVMQIGTSLGKHYYTSDSRTVPVDVLEKLEARDLTLVDDVAGGWAQWEGRPEWSETYVDFSEAEAVEMATEIAERREGR